MLAPTMAAARITEVPSGTLTGMPSMLHRDHHIRLGPGRTEIL
jgi:hypothetical protein